MTGASGPVARRVAPILIALSLLMSLTSIGQVQAKDPGPPEPGGGTSGMKEVGSYHNDTSAPLRTLRAAPSTERAKNHEQVATLPLAREPREAADPVVQDTAAGKMPTRLLEFDGIPFPGVACNCAPPDPNGEVGATQYVQMVNEGIQVYDKTGTSLLGPIDIQALWSGFGGACETQGHGDPIVVYDQLANRWVVTQFAGPVPITHQCIAVSTSADATGSYHRYGFQMNDVDEFYDYPKFGVWPDAYYASANYFNAAGTAFLGAQAFAFDRDAMLIGAPATFIAAPRTATTDDTILPGDVDGLNPPPAGAPNPYMMAGPNATWKVFRFHVDFDIPANSTFELANELTPEPFTPLCLTTRSCVPQAGTTARLDAIADRSMFRSAYRHFADGHEALVGNMTVCVGGTGSACTGGRAGVRWFEIDNVTSGIASFVQQSTFAPDDGIWRWMGSAAMDANGNLAVGYSASSGSVAPGIRYAGRLATDPPNQLAQGEAILFDGIGSQTGTSSRWGDYSDLTVDPTDDCTFWYTNEYYPAGVSSFNWRTRIGSFRFPNCSSTAGTLEGTVTDATSGDPLEGATVEVTPLDVSTTTDASGHYALMLPADTYDVTASAFAHESATATDIVVAEDETTTQDFALDALPSTTVSGTVTDGFGHGWPLYATITIDGYPGGPIHTDPVTGAYSVSLPQATPFTFHVNAVVEGYLEATRDANYSTGTATENFALDVDAAECVAPGYAGGGLSGLQEGFDAGALPAGWAIVDNIGNGQVWAFNDPGGRGNRTGGTGPFAMVDSDEFGTTGSQNTELITPLIDLSSSTQPTIRFNTDYNDWSADAEIADVDLSLDGGTTWENVWRQQGADIVGPAEIQVGVPQAAGQNDVKVRFHYYNATFAFWWEVDNVGVGEPVCDPIPGGMVVGNVYDLNNGEPLNDATVVSDDAPDDTATTAPTPDDPGLDDGYYSMFSSVTGEHSFTASFPQYSDTSVVANVAADGTTRVDFELGSGLLTVDPTSLEATIKMGGSATRTFTVSNEGTGAADVTLSAGGATFVMLGSEGTGTGSPLRYSDEEAFGAGEPAGESAPPYEGGPPTISKRSFRTLGRVTPLLPPTNPDELTITHSVSQEIVGGNSVACSPDGGFTTTENGYLRTFTLSDFDIDGDFAVTSVSFGIEDISPAQTLTINLYTLEGDFVYANLTPIGSAQATIEQQTLSLVTVPVEGVAPAGSTLVVEIDAPDQSGAGRLFIGSNNAGQTAPSYLRSESCGLPEPTDTADIGFPGMHIVMNVTGETGAGGVPWLTIDPLSFSLDPGESQLVTVGLDANVEQPGAYGAQITVGHDTPSEVDPVSVTMDVTPPNQWGKLAGTVTGVACDGTVTPLEDATVQLTGTGFAVTLTTGEDGTYAWWMDVRANPLNVIAALDGYVPQSAETRIRAKKTTVLDFALQHTGC